MPPTDFRRNYIFEGIRCLLYNAKISTFSTSVGSDPGTTVIGYSNLNGGTLAPEVADQLRHDIDHVLMLIHNADIASGPDDQCILSPIDDPTWRSQHMMTMTTRKRRTGAEPTEAPEKKQKVDA